MVLISAEGSSKSCAFKRAFSSPRACEILCKIAARSFSRICAAALLVKVTASTSLTLTPFKISETSRSIITAVLPLPAEAETITLPRREIAACCSSVNCTLILLPPALF